MRDTLHYMTIRGTLVRFSDSSADLTEALQENVELAEEDLLFIENHLLMIQMAYTEWKRTNHPAHSSR